MPSYSIVTPTYLKAFRANSLTSVVIPVARTKLGWSPKHNLDDLIQDMMDADIKLFKKEILLNQSGFTQNRQFE